MATQEVLRTILSDLGLDVKQFSERIDYPASKLYDIQRGKTIKFKDDLISRILAVFPKYNRIWLLTGEGDRYVPQNVPNGKPIGKKSEKPTQSRDSAETMLTTPTAQNEQQHSNHTSHTTNHTAHLQDTYGTPTRQLPDKNTPQRRTLPLIPIDAVAGFNGWDESGIAELDCARYDVPDFAAVHADFLIRVSGSSMYPKYSSGDILACRKIVEVTFIQWGKIYVIDSQQGAMVKRLFEIEGDADHILCKSDNENYPPFKLPKEEIRSLSIVVGAIRLE